MVFVRAFSIMACEKSNANIVVCGWTLSASHPVKRPVPIPTSSTRLPADVRDPTCSMQNAMPFERTRMKPVVGILDLRHLWRVITGVHIRRNLRTRQKKVRHLLVKLK